MARCVGVGKVRHLELRYLWVQQQLEERNFTLQKVSGGTRNVPDMFTKANLEILNELNRLEQSRTVPRPSLAAEAPAEAAGWGGGTGCGGGGRSEGKGKDDDEEGSRDNGKTKKTEKRKRRQNRRCRGRLNENTKTTREAGEGEFNCEGRGLLCRGFPCA